MPLALIASAALVAAVGVLAFARAVLARPAQGGSAPAADVDAAAERGGVVAPPPSSNDNADRLYEAVERELRAGGHLR